LIIILYSGIVLLMNNSLYDFFSLLDSSETPGDKKPTENPCELFSDTLIQVSNYANVSAKKTNNSAMYANPSDIALIHGLYSSGINFQVYPKSAHSLYDLSVNAFDVVIHVWMSELSLEQETLEFGRKVLASKDRVEAERVAHNRADSVTRLIHETAYKVWHEVDRLRGLLRFSPDNKGIFIARCEPDYFVLPALAEHFRLRFGSTPWLIIDEKRRISLCCTAAGIPEINVTNPGTSAPITAGGKNDNMSVGFQTPASQAVETQNTAVQTPVSQTVDPWEKLWLDYHKTINNESRNNPDLQRQFMPKRYWKNLPEMKVE